MLRFAAIQSYSYTEKRKVETDVDRITWIELATLQLRKPKTERLSYVLRPLKSICSVNTDIFLIVSVDSFLICFRQFYIFTQSEDFAWARAFALRPFLVIFKMLSFFEYWLIFGAIFWIEQL